MQFLGIRSPIRGFDYISSSKCNELSTLESKLSKPIFHALPVSRMPLPSEMNVVLRYYLDWINQIIFGEICLIMLCAYTCFFAETCNYIGSMVEDLNLTLDELKKNSSNITEKLSTEIAFHNEILE